MLYMRVLVGCECSSVVTSAFRSAGHEAFSCDLVSCYGDLPEFHFQGDLHQVYDFVNPDLFICHPPCTFLSDAGACRLYSRPGSINHDRYEKGLAARDFFFWCWSRPAKMVCIENPVPLSIFRLPSPSQIIQPFYFGDPYSKMTFLWLRGLPFLSATSLVRPVSSWTAVHRSSRIRSQTFRGIASAMASQWGGPGFQELQLAFDFS